MRNDYFRQPDGYRESIRKGMNAARSFLGGITRGDGSREEQIRRLHREIREADAVVIGAGAGLSTAAGFTYSGERFHRYFRDFEEKFGIADMYSGGFYPFPEEEIRWAWWARHIYYNRYVDAPEPVYTGLLKLVEEKDYFVITTNVDHQFQRAGFDKKRLFYTQGDYGLFQPLGGKDDRTWDNEEWVMDAMEAQGFVKDENGIFQMPADGNVSMRIPSDLIPADPVTGGPVTMNLRADDTFVEDDGWRKASAAYADFLRRHSGMRVLYMEIGVGHNTPVIIKYPFWQMTKENSKATYACLSRSDPYCPKPIEKQSVCIDGDFMETLKELQGELG